MLEKNEQVLNQIKKAKNILIAGYVPWNEEIIPSALALQLALDKLGKKSEIILETEKDKDYLKPSLEPFQNFPNFSKIKNRLDNLSDFVISLDLSQAKIGKVKYKVTEKALNFYITPQEGIFRNEDVSARNTNFKYDLIITLGTPDLELLGENYKQATEFFYQTPIINIDNQASNEEYGQINLIDLTKPSMAEVIFSLFEEREEKYLDSEVSHCLLAGIIYKTHNFKTPVTPHTLSAAYNLITWGADKEKIINQFYRSQSLNTFKLWGKALNNLSQGEENSALAWTTLLSQDFRETETREYDLINLINELTINIPKIEIFTVFYGGEKKSNALISARKNIDLKNLFSAYSPAGNNKFLQIKTDKNLDEFKKEIIALLNQKLNSAS